MAYISGQDGVKEQWAELISVQTRHLQAQAEVVMENSVHESFVLMYRSDDGSAVSLQRAQSPFRITNAVK